MLAFASQKSAIRLRRIHFASQKVVGAPFGRLFAPHLSSIAAPFEPEGPLPEREARVQQRLHGGASHRWWLVVVRSKKRSFLRWTAWLWKFGGAEFKSKFVLKIALRAIFGAHKCVSSRRIFAHREWPKKGPKQGLWPCLSCAKACSCKAAPLQQQGCCKASHWRKVLPAAANSSN